MCVNIKIQHYTKIRKEVRLIMLKRFCFVWNMGLLASPGTVIKNQQSDEKIGIVLHLLKLDWFCWPKKRTVWKLWVILLDAKWDNISASSEKLLQRGREVSASLMKVTGSHKHQSSPWRILVPFYIWGDTRIGLIKSAPEGIKLSKDMFWQFFQRTQCLISALHLELLSRGCWKLAAAIVHDVIFLEVNSKCQFAIDNSNWIESTEGKKVKG